MKDFNNFQDKIEAQWGSEWLLNIFLYQKIQNVCYVSAKFLELCIPVNTLNVHI